MVDNKIRASIGQTGLASNFSIQLIDEEGTLITPLLAVEEITDGRGTYQATMTGAAGTYSAQLLYNESGTLRIVMAHSGFRWSGTEFIYGADQSEIQSALTAQGYTTARAGYQDKLNVSGTIANSDEAATYQADVSGLLTTTAYTASLPSNFDLLSINGSGQVPSSNAYTGTPPTTSEIADAVWDETLSSHNIVDSAGLKLDSTSTHSPTDIWFSPTLSQRTVTVEAYDTGQSPADLVDLSATNAAITVIDGVVDAIKLVTDKFNFNVDNDVIATTNGENQTLSSSERTAIVDAINLALDIPSGELAAIASQVRTELATELSRIDTTISSRNDVAPDNAGISTLLARLTALRAGYLDKLNVSGTIAHSDDANTYKADISALLSEINTISFQSTELYRRQGLDPNYKSEIIDAQVGQNGSLKVIQISDDSVLFSQTLVKDNEETTEISRD